MFRLPRIHDEALHEYEATCGSCGFQGKGNGNKPAKCPACGFSW